MAVAGGLGETDIGGPVMNLVPRSGGNKFRGSAFINNAGNWSRGNNLTPNCAPSGTESQETPGIINSYDASVSYRRPDQARSALVLWQLSQPRNRGGGAGRRANANAYDASRWDWVADPSVTPRTLQGRTIVHREDHGAGIRQDIASRSTRSTSAAARGRR